MVILVVLFSLFSSVLSAATVSMSLQGTDSSTGKHRIGVGQTFRLNVTINDTQDQSVEADIDGIENFNIHSRNSSTSISLFNSQMSSKVTQSYTLSARQEGEYTLGPARVNDGGSVFSSQSVAVVAAPGSVSPTEQQRQQGQQAITLSAEFSVDSDDVVVGQPVVAKLEITYTGNLKQLSISPPRFSGFSRYEIEQTPQYQKAVDGKLVKVIEKSYVLIPDEAGTYNVPGVVLSYQVPSARRQIGLLDDNFFSSFFGQQSQPRQVQSNGVTLVVKELPSYAVRAQGVGSFDSFSLKVDKTEVTVNEPVGLTLTLQGRGNLDQVVTPKLKLPKICRAFDSRSDVHHNFVRDFGKGAKTFEYVVQVGKQGKHTIPAQSFLYYDPIEKKMKTLKTHPVEIMVTAPVGGMVHDDGQQNGSSDALPEQPGEEQKDIAYIDEVYRAPPADWQFPWYIFILILLTFCGWHFGYDLPVIVARLRVFLTRFKRNESLHVVFSKRVKTEAPGKLYGHFTVLIARRFGLHEKSLNQSRIEQVLTQHGWSAESVQRFSDYLHECALAAFTKDAAGRSKHLLNDAQFWVDRLCDVQQGDENE